MPNQFDEKTDDQPSSALGYATHVGEYPQTIPRAGRTIFLIGITALSGLGSIILGLCFVADKQLLAIMLITAGVSSCWATFGKLSANYTRLRSAIALLSISEAFQISVVVMSHRLLQEQILLYGEDSSGNSVYYYEIIRNSSFVPAVLGGMTLIYAVSRLLARRGNDFN